MLVRSYRVAFKRTDDGRGPVEYGCDVNASTMLNALAQAQWQLQRDKDDHESYRAIRCVEIDRTSDNEIAGIAF